MAESIEEKVSFSKVQQNIEAYIKSHDTQYVTEDAVFINISTGERTVGRKAIAEMLHFMYHVAFDAVSELKTKIITSDNAVLEANFKGRHIGEFAGLPATNKIVNIPFCVLYDLKNGLIKEARIYMLGDLMMKQLSEGN